MKKQRTQRADGFTLLEVMIALAIVAIALVTLLGLSNRTVLVHEHIQKLTRATLLAQQLMSEQEVQVEGVGAVDEEREGIFEEPFADFNWRIYYENTMIPQVRQIHVRVSWGQEQSNQQVELISFVAAGGP
ncbi:MAG TPA: type II secretion system protein [Pelovirga sp.]|nr:type II secretion system protein [Pelovirga sp.]